MKNPLAPDIYTLRSVTEMHPVRGEYFRDQAVIVHSTAFRRLKDKTQVFFSPENDHICTRMEHVMHVAMLSVTICKGLNQSAGWALDPEMAFAIGLGHDLGHAPFGHAGEKALSKKLEGSGLTFIHELQSLRVADKLSNYGQGLNLTYAVRDGMVNHNGEKLEKALKPSATVNNLSEENGRLGTASTYEGCIVRMADSIAYMDRDIEDALLAGFIRKSDLPENLRDWIGTPNLEKVNPFALDLIHTSAKLEEIRFSEAGYESLVRLHAFNEQYIYHHPTILRYRKMCEAMLEFMFDHLLDLFSNNGLEMGLYSASELDVERQFGKYIQDYDIVYRQEKYHPKKIVCDFIAGMTDNYAFRAYQEITLPKPITFIA